MTYPTEDSQLAGQLTSVDEKNVLERSSMIFMASYGLGLPLPT